MPSGQGRQRCHRHFILGLAAWISCAAIVLLSGCNRLPLRLVDAMPSASATTKVESAAPPAELPPLPSTPLSELISPGQPHADRTEPLTDEEPGRSTPLLDAALARASEAKTSAPSEAPVVLPVLSPTAERTERKSAPALDVVPSQPSPPLSPTAEHTGEKPPDFPPLGDEEKKAPSPPGPGSMGPERSAPTSERSRPINPEKSVSSKPSDPWGDGLRDLRAFAARQSGEPGRHDETWLVRSRVIDWLASEPNDSPPDPAWSTVLSALVAATGPEPVDPPVLAPKIQEAVGTLESLAPLAIVDLKLCRKILGFGHRDLLESSTIKPNQSLLIYCEISGLRYEKLSEGYQSRMTSEAEIVPANGGEPVWSQAMGAADDHCRMPRRDYFVNYRIPLPAIIAPGDYHLRLTQHDILSGQEASATVPFRIIP